MILLERKKSHKLEVLEALNCRLPETDKDFEHYKSMYNRTKKGYYGELRVDKAWSEIMNSDEYCLLHNLELINDVENSHQIDTLFICPHFMLVVEIKNISGRLDFDVTKHQFTQTLEDGTVNGYQDPIDQAKRHVRYLSTFNCQLPIVYAIIISDPSTFIGSMPRNEPIFHLSGLYEYVHFLYKKHARFSISNEELMRIGKYLKSINSPSKWRFDINPERLRKGIYCDRCNYKVEMEYYRGDWRCGKCLFVSKDVLLQGMDDYRLLVSETITSQQFREFFKIKSPDVSKRLLKTLDIPFKGSNKWRVYTIISRRDS